MRTFVAAPGQYPGILCYSDIFQLSGPMLQFSTRLAGYGFVIAAPEIYHRREPLGAVIPFDDAGRNRGLEDAARRPVVNFDMDRGAALDYLARHPSVATGQLGAKGFCIGGHLAFRASLEPDVRATVYYGTGIRNGKLSEDRDAGSLACASAIRGKLLMAWGSQGPHVPEAGRVEIERALHAAGVDHAVKVYPAEHAFMFDEGPRYDPEATDRAFADMIALFQGVFGRRL